jgi:1,2-diacylglycerol 3-alpha-glucosyltransferase
VKILMMTNTYTPIVGGLERSIQDFSEIFRKRGHEVKIVAPEFEGRPEDEKDVIRVPAMENVAGTPFSLSLPLPETLQNLVNEFDPDIVHSHHPFLIGDLALRLCGQRNIPLVFTYHIMFEYYTDHFAMDKEAVKQFVVELAAGYANMTDHVIVPSESVAKVLQGRKVKAPISVVPTGIDVERFAPAPSRFRNKFKIPENKFVLGHVGRLSPEKNLIFLAEAVAAFLEKNKEAHFLVVGSGPSEREVRKIFEKKGVKKQVHFAGVQKGRALIEAYHAMDAFAFASKSETQGIVLAEAMAAGLPVVALDAAGVREVVKDMENGRLVALESLPKFAAALSWCALRSPAQWSEIKKKAMETARTYSSELCADRALSVYKNVVRRQNAFSHEESSQWEMLLGRFKTEFSMMLNLGKAAGSALVSAVADNSPKDKLLKVYQKRIKKMRRSGMLMLKEIRKQMGEASEEERKKLELIAESLAQKIRTHESQLIELNRNVQHACESFEKFIADAQQEMEQEVEKNTPTPSASA